MATLDAVIHAPNRLQICAALASSAELEFKFLKDQLEVSDSVLSKHLKTLEEAGYITIKKRSEFSRPRTWIALSVQGRSAFSDHVAALKEIVAELN